jgi:hypothetical protein
MFQTDAVENVETHFVFSNFFENRAFYETTWKTFVERGRPHDKKAHAHNMLDT